MKIVSYIFVHNELLHTMMLQSRQACYTFVYLCDCFVFATLTYLCLLYWYAIYIFW